MPEIENANFGSLTEDIDCIARARVVLTLKEWRRVTPSLKVFWIPEVDGAELD